MDLRPLFREQTDKGHKNVQKLRSRPPGQEQTDEIHENVRKLRSRPPCREQTDERHENVRKMGSPPLCREQTNKDTRTFRNCVRGNPAESRPTKDTRTFGKWVRGHSAESRPTRSNTEAQQLYSEYTQDQMKCKFKHKWRVLNCWAAWLGFVYCRKNGCLPRGISFSKRADKFEVKRLCNALQTFRGMTKNKRQPRGDGRRAGFRFQCPLVACQQTRRDRAQQKQNPRESDTQWLPNQASRWERQRGIQKEMSSRTPTRKNKFYNTNTNFNVVDGKTTNFELNQLGRSL
ncbi:hypothetical protein OUZ56_012176 [Daphnia magna]|uniref:Uncharacterized protein n=1 Tax=Daphnia magna TaxID=35525 RepID=A0ABQ9Z294_9CRUS|nr:hypothetical protein OUZ56_012176 [Daphnia magna]